MLFGRRHKVTPYCFFPQQYDIVTRIKAHASNVATRDCIATTPLARRKCGLPWAQCSVGTDLGFGSGGVSASTGSVPRMPMGN